MSDDTRRFVIKAAPLPSNFRGTPQQLFEALLDRMEVVGDGNLITISDTEPVGNQGPWLKGGTQWWIWDPGTSHYIPLDVSASVSAQIFTGDAAPDPTEFLYWVKTAGATLLGLFYYVGTTSGWVRVESLELVDNCIQASFLQDKSVSTRAIDDKAVGADQLADNLPVSKLAGGGVPNAGKFLRPDAAGVPTFTPYLTTSAQRDFITGAQAVEITHGVGATPTSVRAVFLCTTAEFTYEVGDAIDSMSSNKDGQQLTLYANATKIGLLFKGAPSFWKKGDPSTSFHPTPGNWKILFIFGVG